MTTSPAQRLMSRRTRTLLPTATSLLRPKVTQEHEALRQSKKWQKKYYDRTARDLPELKEHQTVRIQLFGRSYEWQQARVTKQLPNRSYNAEAANGRTYRRNRVHLRKSKETFCKQPSGDSMTEPELPTKQTKPPAKTQETPPLPRKPIPQKTVTTRSGRTLNKPVYLKDYVLK